MSRNDSQQGSVARTPKRGPRPADKEPFVPHKLIVKFKPGALREAANVASMRSTGAASTRGARALRAALPDTVSGPLALLRRELGVKRIEPLLARPDSARVAARFSSAARGVRSLAVSVVASPRERLEGYTVVEVQEAKIPESVIRRLEASPAVEFAERVANRWTSATRSQADPSQNLQWGLRAIDWFRVRKHPDASDVHVAVLDTGVDARHPDLEGSIEAYHRNGHSVKDLPGHGTHVSGTIAATINNGIGISGVANCRLHFWKVFTDPVSPRTKEKFDDEGYDRSLAAILDSPVSIVNLSLGGYEESRTERDLIETLVAEGVLVIAAMGNEFEDGDPTEWPAAYDDVLAVGAISENGRRASFSNTGKHIGVVAPGSSIFSTVPRYPNFDREVTDYDSWDGTSFATPHVVGCAALLKARNPNRDGKWLHKRICATAIKLAAMRKKSFTPSYGHGLVSLTKML